MQAAINQAGGVLALAKIVGVTPQAVSQWRIVPAHHVHTLSEALKLPLCELLPKRTPEQEARS